jgi:RNA polymerase sigma-70 factor (ECF subfamily)
MQGTMTLMAGSDRRARGDEAAAARRLRAAVESHWSAIGRALRGFGVPEREVDDAAQQTFIVLAERLASVEPGKERSFLYGAAVHVAAHVRRSLARRPDSLVPAPMPSDGSDGRIAAAEVGQRADPSPTPEAQAEASADRAMLDRVLEEMPMELRSVLVLAEVEELSGKEIAAALGIPMGTVASRLRRAREDFEARVRRLRAMGALR